MSAKTGIQWTDATWNPVVGCDRVSPGCAHCYAKQLHDQRHRAFLAGKAVAKQYAEPFETVQLKPDRLSAPLSWRQPKRIFVNSVADLFHDDVPDEFILEVWSVMARAERHTFQVLTKRPARMLRWFTEYLPEACSGEQPAPVWPLPNVWLGVSVENQRFADERIPLLLQAPAAVRFLSCEPLLGHVSLHSVRQSLGGDSTITFDALKPGSFSQWSDVCIDWVIIGGESGKDARPMRVEWLRYIQSQCANAGVPIFVKQLGALPLVGDLTHWQCAATLMPDASSYLLHLRDRPGADMAEWPEYLRVREFPASGVRA